MEITKEWLEEKNVCEDGKEWFLSQKEVEGVSVVKKLIAEDRLDWANWLIVRIMEYKDYVSYVIFIAEKTIKKYEKEKGWFEEYGDGHNYEFMRNAIKFLKIYIKNPSNKNKKNTIIYTLYLDHRCKNSHLCASSCIATAVYCGVNADPDYAYYSTNSALHYFSSFVHSDDIFNEERKINKKILNHGLKLLEESK